MNKIRDWYNQIKNNTSSNDIGLVLVANKSDLKREVSNEECLNLSKELNIKLYETSALTGEGVNEIFEYITQEIISKKNYLDDWR